MLGLSNLKLIAIAVALLGILSVPAWVGWRMGENSVREAARKETEKQVAEVREDADQRVEVQKELLRKQIEVSNIYRNKAETTDKELLAAVKGIEIKHTTITNNIREERATNPGFYELRLPEGGIKQWEEARKLFR